MRARRYPHVHLRPLAARKSLRVAAAMLVAAALSVGNVPAAWADPTPSPTSTARTSAAAFAVTPKPTFTGSMTVGSKLTAVTGTWKPAPDSFAYQWRRNGKLIAGATAPTYRLTAQDAGTKITLTVIGTKTGYPKTSVTSDSKATVTPWAGGPANDTTLIWSTPNCDGSVYEPQNDVSEAQASASRQVASWQSICGVDGYESACEVAGIYSRCLSAAQQFARDNIAVSFPAVPLSTEALGSYTVGKIGEAMSSSRKPSVSTVGKVASFGAQLHDMYELFNGLASAYNQCAPGMAPDV